MRDLPVRVTDWFTRSHLTSQQAFIILNIVAFHVFIVYFKSKIKEFMGNFV